ncbi:redoxin domain-containing protein [Lichenifustis flavocetrariae]|uniref:Peroxiredoxin family protein n=1 Tax=Lichenifustis flavocetrariae TaxID=2949735 RepID=A0AA41Z1Q0_9HYPH|nr:redoxin domain-containing protein [Lichenifustis flavocetrariae]MCW6512584.1 peroxiredoxin family protein [Lichenifustis flavocetrariae]
MSLLRDGDPFPKLEVSLVGGGAMSLPRDVAGSYAIVLIYRGAWCPFCVAQLVDFGTEEAALDALGVRVTALSVDDEAVGTALVAKHDLPFPVGHSAAADAISATTGAFTNAAPHHLQPAAFILGPDGLVVAAVYSTHAVGRLVAADVISFVGYMKSRSTAEAHAAE